MRGSVEDKFLIEQCLAGDEQAFGVLFEKYSTSIYRYVLVRVRNTSEAEDLTSEVFLRVWQYLSSEEREIGNFRALLFRIARNLIIDNFRKKSASAFEVEMESAGEIIDETDDIVRKVEIEDDDRIIYEFLDQRIQEQMKDFAAYEKIKYFALLEHDFSQASGELTPTLKVRREAVLSRYQDAFVALYAHA